VNVTIAIPTYARGAIVVETIARLLALRVRATAILIVDQTASHPAEIETALRGFEARGEIEWVRLPEPSIPHAMNRALVSARTKLVLFLDDDIVPGDDLVAAHVEAHSAHDVAAVVGQILQPGEEPRAVDLTSARDLEFPFFSSTGRMIANVMAGNLSVDREKAIAVGGFDENFTETAYRFETDFAWRLLAAGEAIWFEPRASLRHLKASTGGLRTWGHHLRSASPAHSTGDYYLALTHFTPGATARHIARRLRKTVLTRFDLTHPWWIPLKVVREIRAFSAAVRLRRRGRRLLR
jgi:GT2 family glycosyltransferase